MPTNSNTDLLPVNIGEGSFKVPRNHPLKSLRGGVTIRYVGLSTEYPDKVIMTSRYYIDGRLKSARDVIGEDRRTCGRGQYFYLTYKELAACAKRRHDYKGLSKFLASHGLVEVKEETLEVELVTPRF